LGIEVREYQRAIAKSALESNTLVVPERVWKRWTGVGGEGRLEERTDLLFDPKGIQGALQEMRDTIHSINALELHCPFCKDGTLQVADYTHDPFIWLQCSNCKAQVKLSRSMPEPVFERHGAGGEWEITRVTTDREARAW